ncbi:MAG: hypothetical protein AB1750_19925 [Chloroflexota bacterium]
MSFSQVLEVAIGLVLVYYLLGSIVSWTTKMILELQETRGKTLETYLQKIAGDKTVDLTQLPQIKALQPIRYKNALGVFGANTEAKKVEKIPVSTLVDAFFDITGLTGRPEVDASGLKEAIGALPDSEGKTAMLKWIDQGVTNINELRNRTNAYFAGLLDQAAQKFKANARSFVILLSIGLTLFLGTDSIQLAKDLWNNAEIRMVTAAQADALVQQGGAELDVDQIIEELSKLSIIKFGWWSLEGALPEDSSAGEWASFIFFKLVGLGLTAAAVSQGSSFWYDFLKKLTSPPKPSGGGEEAKG